MPTPVQFPDGQYDFTHTWQNANDRVSYERTFKLDPVEQGKIAVALGTADPATPEAQITANLTVPGVPPRFGYRDTPFTIGDMFTRNLGHMNDFAPTNFSGQLGEFSGSSTPATPAW
jgi:hypothetical protein